MSPGTIAPTPGPRRGAYDVIVVGARPAGASTALLLARAGLSVLVLDRGRYGTDTLSTHALMRGGVLQLARWGLLDRIVASGATPIRSVRFHYAHGGPTVAVSPADGVDALYAPRRTVLDPLLVDAALAAGAEVCYGVVVTGLVRDDRGRVTGVRARTHDGREVSVTARLVVGADGARSTVADAAGAGVTLRGRSACAFTYGYWSGLETEGYELAYRTGVMAGFIPTNDGEVCVFAGSTPGRLGRGGRRVLDALVAQASPDMASRLAAASTSGVVRTFPGRPGLLRRAWGPGWALVGDAGSWKDPISTHGLTDALRDAELLARAVVAGAGDDVREADALDDYERVRDRLTAPLLTLSDEIAAFGWTDDGIAPLVRRLSAVMSEEVGTILALDTPLPSTIGALS